MEPITVIDYVGEFANFIFIAELNAFKHLND